MAVDDISRTAPGQERSNPPCCSHVQRVRLECLAFEESSENLLTGVVPPYLRHHTGGHMCDGAGPVKKLLDLVRPGVPTFQGDEKARVQHDFFHAEDFTRQRTRRPRNR